MLRRLNIPAEQLHSICPRYIGTWPHRAFNTAAQPCCGPQATTDDEAEVVAAGQSPTDDALCRLEAVLFLARESLNTRKLAQYANLADGTQARTLVRRLNARYDAAGRAFRVEQVAGGYQLLTRGMLAPWLRRLAHVPSETRLSAPALETLAVIAYRQPVPRADIEAVRGVNCGEILRQLMERDLVRIGGRSQELGRPYLYATTKRFLELFGLNSIEELPRAEELRTSPLPSAPPIFPPSAADESFTETETTDEPVIDETGSESTLGD